MFFWVHLCLEGLSVHAWWSDIAKHVVRRKCSLQSLEGMSASKEDTRTLNLWAWMANPSTITKMAWITFPNRRNDTQPPLAGGSSCLPDKWKCGLTYRVLVHLDYNEDHSAAPLDDFITASDMVPYEPILGAIDGMPKSKGGPGHAPQSQQGGRSKEDGDNNLAGCQPQHQ